MSESRKRFEIALSFPGEYRGFVEQVAGALARKRVLYDRYYEAELARPDLDTYLQALYHDESDLVAVFLCAEYEQKEWCGLEWRAIRDLIKKRRTADVMLFRFDDTEIPGLFSGDGYVWIGERSAQETAKLILERYALNTGKRIHEDAPRVRVAVDRLPAGGRYFVAREDELRRLDDAWSDDGIDAISIVAWGGVGKSALVDKWLQALRADDWRGARRVYGWSFYSQGTEERLTSADAFVDDALRWFGDPDPSVGSARDRGLRLAEFVRREPTLLVLDGVEPLQHPPGPLGGRLKDPALAALVKSLARSNNGLLVISTREAVDDIANLEDASAPRLDLGKLSDDDAEADLDEAEEIAERGQMLLHLADVHLERTRLHLASGEDVRARERLDAAAELVERCGYGRRRPEVAFLEAVLRERSA